MTGKQFYDWQTSGGTNDVMKLVDCLEKADIAWCAIGGVAVNHWARQAMVTQDVDFVVVAESIERAVSLLVEAGFQSERFPWSVNFKGHSAVSLQLSTEDFYKDFPSRSVAADVNGILLRVACLRRHAQRQNKGMGRAGAKAKQASKRPYRYRPPRRGASALDRDPARRTEKTGAGGIEPSSPQCSRSILLRNKTAKFHNPAEPALSEVEGGFNNNSRGCREFRCISGRPRPVEQKPEPRQGLNCRRIKKNLDTVSFPLNLFLTMQNDPAALTCRRSRP